MHYICNLKGHENRGFVAVYRAGKLVALYWAYDKGRKTIVVLQGRGISLNDLRVDKILEGAVGGQ